MSNMKKSREDKILLGTFRKDRDKTYGPFVEGKMPVAPTFLLPEAKKEWKRIAQSLYKVGLLTYLDKTAFAMYCQTYAHWKKTNELLKNAELVIDGKQNPLLRISDKLLSNCLMIMKQFGMTPAARSKVSELKIKNENEWGVDNFLNF